MKENKATRSGRLGTQEGKDGIYPATCPPPFLKSTRSSYRVPLHLFPHSQPAFQPPSFNQLIHMNMQLQLLEKGETNNLAYYLNAKVV